MKRLEGTPGKYVACHYEFLWRGAWPDELPYRLALSEKCSNRDMGKIIPLGNCAGSVFFVSITTRIDGCNHYYVSL